jgi:acetyltransferase
VSTYRIDTLLAPKSIAVVGASPRERSLGRIALRNLREGGFAGPIDLVNPHHPAIDGVKAVASLDAIDRAPEVVVITAPAAEVPGIVAAAGARGVAAAASRNRPSPSPCRRRQPRVVRGSRPE